MEFVLCNSEGDRCQGELTKNELFAALGGLHTGKSASSDGIAMAFYKAFWQDLGDVLVLILNENFHLGILTGSQHEGLLCFLYKKDHRCFVKNWHGVHYLS